MDARESTQDRYASFLVRLWRSAEPAPDDPQDDWHGEVEHIQSGGHEAFASMAELLHLLCQPWREHGIAECNPTDQLL